MVGLVQQAIMARTNGGIPVAAQFIEALRLRFGPSRLGISDYYEYQLYEPGRDFRDKRRFVGWRLERVIDTLLNDDRWRILANDKLLFYGIMRGHGVSYPAIRAIYASLERPFPGAQCFSNIYDAVRFLKLPDNLPIFVKPVHGTFGRGVLGIAAYEQATDEFHLLNGMKLPARELEQSIVERWAHGYLMQDVLRPDPEIEQWCGRRLSSVRMIVGLTVDGPRLLRAIWRIPTGRNMSDNFMHGSLGNMLGALDLANGRVTGVISGSTAQRVRDCTHPDTDTKLVGVILPHWDKAVNTACGAAMLFPGLRLQHWDIALSDIGPVAIEVNVEGSLDLPQHAEQRGMLEDDLLDMLATHEAGHRLTNAIRR